ncbi:nucleophile aminohydrolase [Dioszegia hungarica]|uniref:Nucleophile aminohydrolase n=1 Tax=Dioszegia hungarica TaxID=4972 RepID=A0AA38LYF2_9TREE|nr:nucleophile aminohydrolase [Dioszegia hungarica]KAI9638894.1 nucleophile aminohydrolase [Dioszegia hungarica]
MTTPILSGAVCSEHRLASQVGTEMLAAGGSAADAMIATVLAINTLCPYHSDLGGGGFAIVRSPAGEYQGLDFRQHAPAAVTMEFYQNGASTSKGGAAVAVPGELRGLEQLHQQYGRLPWSKLFEPSIKFAEEGVPYTCRECVPGGSDQIEGSFYQTDEMYAPLFPDGKALPPGAKYPRPEFARTLRLLADRGADGFYEGEVAEALIKVVRERGGLMSLDDLKNFQPRWIDPIQARYRDYTLWTLPAPASGAIWLSAMGMLSQLDRTEEGAVLGQHRVTEALRLAFGQRTELGDPAFVPGLQEKQASWISEEGSRRRSEMISDERTFPPEYYMTPSTEIKYDSGTSNITTADSSGLVISLTTTVGWNWGSKIMVPGYGFVLNNSMDDFSVQGRPNGFGYEPTPANYVQGGKKPLSSSCPYIVEDSTGCVVLSGGAAGGSTIISSNIQVARNVLDFGMSAAEALRANRLHDQIQPNVTYLERTSTTQGITVDGHSEELADGLREKGHVVEWVTAHRSTPCAMRFTSEGKWEAAGDPRKHDSGGSESYA